MARLFAVDVDGDGRPDILQVGGTPLPAAPDLGYRTFLNRYSESVTRCTERAEHLLVRIVGHSGVDGADQRQHTGHLCD